MVLPKWSLSRNVFDCWMLSWLCFVARWIENIHYGFGILGIEVKPGQSLIVKPGIQKYLHLSQVLAVFIINIVTYIFFQLRHWLNHWWFSWFLSLVESLPMYRIWWNAFIQATLGEIKSKANENVTIFLKIGGQKLVLGILSAEKFPQLSFDLVFEKEFEISHNGKGGSIYCAGYQAFADDQEQYPSFLIWEFILPLETIWGSLCLYDV